MTTKKTAPKNQYMLWDGTSYVSDGDTVLTCDTPAFSEGDALDLMNNSDSDVLYMYELVPVRKYERRSGVAITEIKKV